MGPWRCFRCGCGQVDVEKSSAADPAGIVKTELKPGPVAAPTLPINQDSNSSNSGLLAVTVDAGQRSEGSKQSYETSPIEIPDVCDDDWTDVDGDFFTPKSHLSSASVEFSLAYSGDDSQSGSLSRAWSGEAPSRGDNNHARLTAELLHRGERQGRLCGDVLSRGSIQGRVAGEQRVVAGDKGGGGDKGVTTGEEAVTAVLEGAVARLSNSALAQQLQDLCDQGRTRQAHDVLVKVSKERKVSLDALAEELEAEAFDVKDLIRQESLIQKTLSVVTSEEGWRLVLDIPNLQISHKQRLGSHVHNFRSKATLDCPVHHVLCLAREFDLLPKWVKYIPESAILKEISARELIVYFVQWMPWPVSSIDFLLNALIADLLDSHGFLLVPTYSIKLPADCTLPPGASKRSRLQLESGSGFSVTPLPPATPGGPERCQVCMVYQLDAGMPVPNVILEFVMKVFGPFVFRMACKMIKDNFKPGGPKFFLERMEQHKEMYELVEQRCRETWQKQQQAGKC